MRISLKRSFGNNVAVNEPEPYTERVIVSACMRVDMPG